MSEKEEAEEAEAEAEAAAAAAAAGENADAQEASKMGSKGRTLDDDIQLLMTTIN